MASEEAADNAKAIPKCDGRVDMHTRFGCSTGVIAAFYSFCLQSGSAWASGMEKGCGQTVFFSLTISGIVISSLVNPACTPGISCASMCVLKMLLSETARAI